MKRNRGAILVEFAFVLPIFLFLILGGIDLMRIENAKSDLDAIVISTAACNAQSNCGTDPQSYARNLAQGFLMAPAATSASCSGNTCTAQYNWIPLSPFFSAANLTATATGANP